MATDTGAAQAGMRVQAFELGVRVVKRMHERGWDVGVCYRNDDAEFEEAVRSHGVTLVPFASSRHGPGRVLNALAAVRGWTGRVDAVYSLNAKLPLGALGRCATAITIHDLCYLTSPEEYDAFRRLYFRMLLRRSLSRVDRIFAISERTRAELQRHFALPPGRVTVAVNGVDHLRFKTDAEDPRALPPAASQPFFLFLGKISPRKNLMLVAQAVALLKERGIAVRVLIVGPPGWRNAAEFAEIRRLGVEQAFIHLGFLDARMVMRLLGSAQALLYPSRCEGFGIPALEALAQGTHAIVARGGAPEEISGGLAIPVDASDPAELASVMDRIQAGRIPPVDRDAAWAQLDRFSWDRSADLVLTELEAMVKPRLG